MRLEPARNYIIVGAGSAGCVLANRLSADAVSTVLLLEAGGWDHSPMIRVPAGEERLISMPRFNWGYRTDPDVSRCDREEVWPAGRVVGGSSSINGMIYVRGNRRDYDHWAELGNTGWDFDSVLPHFIRSESNSRGKTPLRGDSGPLHVSDVRSPHPLAQVFIDAALELGVPYNEDLNGESQFGVGRLQATQKHGWRHSAARAYLWPARPRKNLQVRTQALVHRILIRSGRAVGVEYEAGGRLTQAFADREVIVSAGTLASPKILMHSGIGPAQHLRKIGVPVIADVSGVGENLQEHPGAMLTRRVNVSTYNVEISPWHIVKHGLDWLIRGRGPGTTPIGHAAAFIKTHETSTDPDVQLTFTPIGYNAVGAGPLLYSFPAIVVAVNVCRPLSRGRVLMRSSDIRDPPRIEYEMFKASEDLSTLKAGAKFARRLCNSRAFTPYALDELRPGAQCQSDADWEAYLRREAMRFSHPVGTCKMGIDSLAVVDPELRVYGIDALRVVDASIMPTLPSANTNAATIMIGEKAADLIIGVSAPVLVTSAATEVRVHAHSIPRAAASSDG